MVTVLCGLGQRHNPQDGAPRRGCGLSNSREAIDREIAIVTMNHF